MLQISNYINNYIFHYFFSSSQDMSTNPFSYLSLFSNYTNSSISSSLQCQDSVATTVITAMYSFFNIIFLFPVYILVLYMGFQRWRHQHSAPAVMTMTHSDFFTYNMMILEILGVLGSLFQIVYSYTFNDTILMLVEYLFSVMLHGQSFFHVLTCLERYLAVVHPITYWHLRESQGIKIRNISTVSVWLLCFGWVAVEHLYCANFHAVPFFCYSGICISVISFCCLSVIHGLTRPGPGEVGGNKERLDQSKQKASHMIMAIMGVLLLRFVGILIYFVIDRKSSVDTKGLCMPLSLVFWLTVPSSLVIPLLFLHRAGKLSCYRKKMDSG